VATVVQLGNVEACVTCKAAGEMPESIFFSLYGHSSALFFKKKFLNEEMLPHHSMSIL
jgi:hypothetical protein